jgi:hypothetical protein
MGFIMGQKITIRELSQVTRFSRNLSDVFILVSVFESGAREFDIGFVPSFECHVKEGNIQLLLKCHVGRSVATGEIGHKTWVTRPPPPRFCHD